MKYKVGDKVRVRKDLVWKNYHMEDKHESWLAVSEMHLYRNKVVTISYASSMGYHIKELPVGLWWADEMFEGLANDEKIVITSDGEETLARLYVDGKVVKRATAKCSPEDEFDFNVGAKLAFERLTEPAAEKKEEYYNGKVVCVDLRGGNFGNYTVGKIYQFVDGRTTTDAGDVTPESTPIKTFKEWERFSFSKFIEIKE